MGRGPQGDPVRLRCHVPPRAPQRAAPNEDVARLDWAAFHGVWGKEGWGEMGRCLSGMWHLDTAQDIVSVIGIFLGKWERAGSIHKTSGNLKALAR